MTPGATTTDAVGAVERIAALLERAPMAAVTAFFVVAFFATLFFLLREKDKRLDDIRAALERDLRHEATASALARVAQFLEAKAIEKRRRVSRPDLPAVKDTGTGP